MATTTYSGLSQRTTTYAAIKMLAHAEPILVLSKYGQSKPLPKNKANNVKFRRPIPFVISTTPLSEGVTPTAKQMQYEDVQATIAQYGDVVEITDVVEDLSEDPVLNDSSMLCGEQAAETIELVTWGAIKAGTNVFYTNGASRAVVNTTISTPKQRAITRALKRNRGKKITSMMASSVRWGTEPIDAAFIAFSHTDMESDIRDMTGFVPIEKYGSMKPLPFECGKVEDVRYVLSPVLDPFLAAGSLTLNGMTADDATNVDVYPVIYIAKEAYGVIPLKGKGAIKPHIINPNTPSKSDPLGQKGYVGWKCYFVAKILNELWIARLESGATALS